jgi:peptidoglycan hydrolase CwlO-like protein/cell wall-associated NlpC family hydrolase
MSRRVSLIVLLGLILIMVLSFGVSANAEPQNNGGDGNNEGATIAQSELLQNQDELAQMQWDAAVAAEKYNSARSQVDQLNQNIADTVLKQADTEEGLKKAQASLEKQAVTVYKAGPLYLLDFLLSAESFSDFANRLWFSIKALLGMADEVQDFRKQSNELEQIKVDLKANMDTAQQAQDEAEVEREAALASAEELKNEIDARSQDNSDPIPQENLEAAQQFVDGIEQMPSTSEPAGLGGPNQQADTETPHLPEETVQSMGIPQKEIPVVQEKFDNAIQAGNEAQAAQNDLNKAAGNLANKVASLDPPSGNSPGDGIQSAPLNNNSGNSGFAPLNNSGTQTTPTPNVSQNPELSKLANEFQAAKDKAQLANANAQAQGANLANALGNAQPPAIAGAQPNNLNPANKLAADPKTASTPNVSAGPKGASTPNTSTNPSSGGTWGPAAVAMGMQQMGKPYAMGTDGPNTFSCTGLMRWIARNLGLGELPWAPSAYLSLPHREGAPVAGDIGVWGDGVGMWTGSDVLMANEVQGKVTTVPLSALGEPIAWVHP